MLQWDLKRSWPDTADWFQRVLVATNNLRSDRMGSSCMSGRYSQLVEEESEWNSSFSYCWIECLPLELLRKVFLHLATEDLKVRYIITCASQLD